MRVAKIRNLWIEIYIINEYKAVICTYSEKRDHQSICRSATISQLVANETKVSINHQKCQKLASGSFLLSGFAAFFVISDNNWRVLGFGTAGWTKRATWKRCFKRWTEMINHETNRRSSGSPELQLKICKNCAGSLEILPHRYKSDKPQSAQAVVFGVLWHMDSSLVCTGSVELVCSSAKTNKAAKLLALSTATVRSGVKCVGHNLLYYTLPQYLSEFVPLL